MITFKELLIDINACEEARLWAGDRTIEEVLRDSWRGDWLLWLAKKLDLPLNKLTLAKARCAKTVIHLMKDKRSVNAVNVAEKFGLDECTLEELNNAANAAYAASYAANAAYAASYVANAAYVYAAYTAAYAADAYAYAYTDAVASYAANARKKNRQKTSDICVEILGELLTKAVNSRLTK